MTLNTDTELNPKALPAATAKDRLLRSKVKLFGNILGKLIRKHANQQVFNAVETLRKGHISLSQQDDPNKRRKLMEFLESLDAGKVAQVIRAFSTYFSLVNVAEEAYEHRQRRRELSRHTASWIGSFGRTLKELADEGVTAEQMQHLLNQPGTENNTCHIEMHRRRVLSI